MSIELHKIALKNALFVFVSTTAEDRLACIARRFKDAGFKSVGPRAWSLKAVDNDAVKIKTIVAELGIEDCVYVLGVRAGELDASIIVQPRTVGGITVGSQ